jgi:putative methyltransferase (TIGR04325 family)
VFSSFAEAVKFCGGSYYDNASFARVAMHKTLMLREQLQSQKPVIVTHPMIRVGLMFSLLDEAELTVLDFGGACGTHYFHAKTLFSNRVKLRWSVVELPEVVELARAFQNQELRFLDNLEAAVNELGDIDVLLCDGVLPHTGDIYGWLQRLVACGAKHLYLRRLPVTTSGNSALFKSVRLTLSKFAPLAGPLPPDVPDAVVHIPMEVPELGRVRRIISETYSIEAEIQELNPMYTDRTGETIDAIGLFAIRKRVASLSPLTMAAGGRSFHAFTGPQCGPNRTRVQGLLGVLSPY